eukprot:COSAG05_NODE_6398_length_967_cov_0.647465_2_plen_69_part_00
MWALGMPLRLCDFLGSAKPNFIDTSLLGNVRITFTLAGGDIIATDNAAAARAYSVANQHFSVSVLGGV